MTFQLIFLVAVIALVAWVPESLRWFLRKGRLDNAASSLRLLYHDDKDYNPMPAIKAMQDDVDEEILSKRESAWIQLLTDPTERRKVTYSAGALVAQQINGIQWFYYLGTVFSKAIGLSGPFFTALIVFIIQEFVVLAAVLLANKLPRRPLLLITTDIMTMSFFCCLLSWDPWR